MSIYDELQGVANGLLKEFNQGGIKLIHLTFPSTSTPDEPGEPEETVYDLDGVATGVEFKYMKDSFTATAEKEVTVAVRDDVVPTENDFIEIDGYRYKIIKDVSVPQAGTRCVWKFLVSKGG